MRSVVEHSLRAAPLLACLVLVAALAAGCGGGGSSSAGVVPTPTPTPTPGLTPAQIRIGDAAVDSIVDFEFSVGSPVVFTMSGATGAVSITPGPNRFELSHLAAKMEPLDLLNVPPASYVSAQLTIQDPELTFLTAQGTPVTVTGATQTVIVPLNPPLTIGSAATVVNLDVNIANSIVESNGTITGFNFTPSSFAFTSKPIAAEAEQQDDSGEVEGLVGLVSAINGTSFTLNLTSNSQLVFNTDSNTQYTDGLTSLASALNQLVQVEGVSKPDGSLFTKELERLESQSGSELDGLITAVTPGGGAPATALTLLAQDGIGNGMDPAKIGQTFTADVSGLSAGKYVVDQQKCDFSGLTVPSATLPFDSTTIHAGQRVEIENIAGVPAVNGSFTADRIKLEQQAISGTVSNVFVFSGSGGVQIRFDLTLPSDSHLAILSGLPSPVVVQVIAQPGTDNKFGTIAENTIGPVRVRGLLFWTGTTFNMIARRITQP